LSLAGIWSSTLPAGQPLVATIAQQWRHGSPARPLPPESVLCVPSPVSRHPLPSLYQATTEWRWKVTADHLLCHHCSPLSPSSSCCAIASQMSPQHLQTRPCRARATMTTEARR
jgi:hypothetical protein